jgi:hypothetical protein
MFTAKNNIDRKPTGNQAMTTIAAKYNRSIMTANQRLKSTNDECHATNDDY